MIIQIINRFALYAVRQRSSVTRCKKKGLLSRAQNQKFKLHVYMGHNGRMRQNTEWMRLSWMGPTAIPITDAAF